MINQFYFSQFNLAWVNKVWCGMLLRGKGRSIPLPNGVWINRPQGLTAKAVRTKVKSYPHSMTNDWLDKEGNAGHSIIITGWNGGRRKKPNDWPLVQMPSFSLAEVWKWKFSSGQTLARDRRQFSQAPAKSRTESLDRRQQKGTFSCKRKEPEN